MAPVSELRARIRRYNGGLDPDGETFRAALVLVAACEYGQNVELLARRTGLPRPFVARCARRLIDNGVWEGGRTVAEWAPEDPASGNFWNDAAVAEGKMCRRPRSDGSLEWAPAGFWNKNFHFLDPDADHRPGNLYFDSTPPAATPADEPQDAAAGTDNDTEVPADPIVEAAAADDDAPDDLRFEVDDEPDPTMEPVGPLDLDGAATTGPDRSDAADAVPPLHHVFRDAVWIG